MMLLVRDLMTQNPAFVYPDTPLREMLARMHAHACRQLPVLSPFQELIGIVTDRDIRLVMKSPLVLHERWEEEMVLDNMTAAGCMTSPVATIDAGRPAVEAAQILLAKKYGALPVLSEGRLVGIITVTDFLRQFISEHSSG